MGSLHDLARPRALGARLAALWLAVCTPVACRIAVEVPKPPAAVGGELAPPAGGVGGAPADPCAITPAPAPRTPPVCAPQDGNADLRVRVTSRAGARGGAAFVARGLTSMNISQEVERRGDYVPKPDPQVVTLLSALRPAYLRWVPGHDGQLWLWRPQSTSNPLTSNYELTPALVDAFIALCRAVGAEPLLAINFKTGSDSDAAALLRYCNVEKKYGVKWVQIGNEPDLPADSGLDNPVPLLPTPDAKVQAAALEAYAQRYTRFRDALHEIDPGLKLVAPEMMMGQDFFGFGDGYPEWLTPVAKRLAGQIDAVSWHYYAKYSGTTDTRSSIFVDPDKPENLLKENAPDWPTGGMNYMDLNADKLREVREASLPGAEVWVTEFAEDPGTQYNGRYLSERVVGALWAADLLGRFASLGTNAIFRFEFKGKADHYYALVDSNNVPRPEFGAYWLYAQVMGERWGRVEYGDPGDVQRVAVNAAVRERDGQLGVVLVNKTQSAKRVALTLADFTPYGARTWQLTGNSLKDETIQLNGQTLDANMVGAGFSSVVARAASPCADSVVEVPPYTAQFVAFDP